MLLANKLVPTYPKAAFKYGAVKANELIKNPLLMQLLLISLYCSVAFGNYKVKYQKVTETYK